LGPTNTSASHLFANQSNYFIVRLKVDRRAIQLTVPHLGITKTEKIELKHKTDDQISPVNGIEPRDQSDRQEQTNVEDLGRKISSTSDDEREGAFLFCREFRCWCNATTLFCYTTPCQPLTARTDDLCPSVYYLNF